MSAGAGLLNTSRAQTLAKCFFIQKLTFSKRIIQNRSDNPRSIWSLESIQRQRIETWFKEIIIFEKMGRPPKTEIVQS